MWTTAERSTASSPSPPSTPRLYLPPPRPEGSPRTSLDGGWWPRSADPVAELPGLIVALQSHGSSGGHRLVTHVLLRAADWEGHPRRLRVDGPAATRVVRVNWFDTQPAGLLTAIYADGRRVDLLTVPPATDHAAAWAGLELAAHTTNHLHTPELLTALTAAASAAAPEASGPHDRAGSTIGSQTRRSMNRGGVGLHAPCAAWHPMGKWRMGFPMRRPPRLIN
ncbi:DUF5994 family protein [Actinomadura kijaniata]|uniref:DUF5994 family protein n=1 Tax=Actinomadura kijaniata TaxID=46161 RepID=UPI003F194F34